MTDTITRLTDALTACRELRQHEIDALATCRELRQYDAAEIRRLKERIERMRNLLIAFRHEYPPTGMLGKQIHDELKDPT